MYSFLLWEQTYWTFFFPHDENEPKMFGRDRTIFYIYRTVFFSHNYKKLPDDKKNLFFLKFYFLWSNQSFNYYLNKESKTKTLRVHKRLQNIFNWAWVKMFRFCNNFLFNFFSGNMKLLVLDENYKNYFFFISNHFNNVNLAENSQFFFPVIKNFSNKNWLFFFSKFCNKEKISAFFVSDSAIVNRKLHNISNVGLPIIAFLLHNKDSIIDYTFFFRIRSSTLLYLLSSVFLNYTYFISYNYRLACYKYLFIKKFSICITYLTNFDGDFTTHQLTKSLGVNEQL